MDIFRKNVLIINYQLLEASQKSVKLRSKFNNQIIKLRLPENIKKI